MKKLIFALLLSSTFAFAVNPRKVDTKRLIVAEKKSKSNLSSPCLDRALFIMDFLIEFGFTIEISSKVSSAVYDDCVNNGYNRKN